MSGLGYIASGVDYVAGGVDFMEAKLDSIEGKADLIQTNLGLGFADMSRRFDLVDDDLLQILGNVTVHEDYKADVSALALEATAQGISAGVGAVEGKLDSMEGKLDAFIGEMMTFLEASGPLFSNLYGAVLGIGAGVTAIEGKLDDPSTGLGAIVLDIGQVIDQMGILLPGIGELEAWLMGILPSIQSDVGSVEAKLDDETRFTDDGELAAAVAAILDAINPQLEALESKIDGLTQTVATIESRIGPPTGGVSTLFQGIANNNSAIGIVINAQWNAETKLDDLGGYFGTYTLDQIYTSTWLQNCTTCP
jgi:hypothetical protein